MMNTPNKLNGILTNSKAQILLILLLTVVVFIPALFAGFIWDDDAAYDNPLLKTVDGLWKIWTVPRANFQELHYWPIVYTSFWFEHQLWGNNPVGYHLINILLHALNVVLLWFVLRKIEIPGAGFIAFIFALHPVHVESVAWVIERKDVLSGFFYLTSFLAFLNYLHPQSKIVNLKFYPIALFLFICALLSKSITVSLPLAMLLYLWWKNGRIKKNELILLLPFFIIASIITFLDIQFIHQRDALAPLGLTLLQRVYIAGKSIWFYLGKLIFPINLVTVYPRWNLAVDLLTQYFYPVTFLILLGVLYLGKKYWGRGAFTALAFFAVTLTPTLGFVDFSYLEHSFVADRFQYLASIGPIILVGVVGYKRYIIANWQWKPIFRIIGITVIAILGFLTWKQAELYENDETLFRYTIARNPNACLAYNNLGLALAERNQDEEAMQFYQKALALNPDFAYPYNNLGILLLKEGKTDQAINYFKHAIQRYSVFAEAQNNLGVALAKQGKMEEAIPYFQKTLQLNPYNAQARYNLEKATKELKNGETKEQKNKR
jgi:hypothetical protein